ncbi:GNAT family N-acetyltransferase [Kribbella sandramycini]|uniref:GNAT family N-acetyltransferase n=1 Tax=Kribbella sandramycini TaxID=60450 RepID=A0A7Y4P0A9_9ACTN|nr:GNAT family N-acetyltransferase [Kribbella sandramycini]MBB6569297.1 GNAT superfamily N-acetyltransferase [Kribbella sandramycini]NOL40864.1 GNAT family N-acetyltransferase [Kribbella sandramycini]
MLTVGPLRPIDRADWEHLFAGYNVFYGRATMPDGFYERAWTRFHSGELHALGAHLDNRLVGIAHFLTHASTTSGDSCYLQDLFTAPEARGQGAARALITAVADRATALGCDRLYWSTHESNATARGLYDQVAENRGFIVYSRSLVDADVPHAPTP